MNLNRRERRGRRGKIKNWLLNILVFIHCSTSAFSALSAVKSFTTTEKPGILKKGDEDKEFSDYRVSAL